MLAYVIQCMKKKLCGFKEGSPCLDAHTDIITQPPPGVNFVHKYAVTQNTATHINTFINVTAFEELLTVDWAHKCL